MPAHALNHRRRILALLGMMLLWLCAAPARAGDLYEPDAVKAAFLYRIAGFVEWPPQKSRTRGFTIAVLGDDAVAEQLEALLPRHQVRGLPAQVQRVRSGAQIGEAQMLYVGRGWNGDLRALTRSLAARPVLVVSDREQGLDEGAAINFITADHRVRFEISLAPAQRAGLRLGPGLLAVAVRVRGLSPVRLLCGSGGCGGSDGSES